MSRRAQQGDAKLQARMIRVAVALAVLAGAAIVGTQPASAATSAGTGQASASTASVAPSCVHFKQNFWGTIRVHNTCRSWQRVKVVKRYVWDSGCKQLKPGEMFSTWSPARVDRLERC
ncbi:MAG TPA: hypothetical protein VJT49_23225 [Amycolatopsis sp.]|uniref:hypothetical protein n=1 Tax=Amycolatopsis sp. TaxID=37632 RepID=UPI002B4621AC|nr:hypothetical protein [Amycolatopsis sp.]HKS47969.1 hypothetical protein [Amycolatopsis sp.]